LPLQTAVLGELLQPLSYSAKQGYSSDGHTTTSPAYTSVEHGERFAVQSSKSSKNGFFAKPIWDFLMVVNVETI